MKKFVGLAFAAVGSAISPTLYLVDEAVDLESLINVTTYESENWIHLYNQQLTWPKSTEAVLAKVIGHKESPRGIVLNQETQYSKNRQLGIQVIGRTRLNRRREMYDTGREVSPYEVVIVSAGGGRSQRQT